MKEKLEQLTKAIQSVVPSIMRLEFGCKIETKNEYDIPNIGRMNKIISEYNPDSNELKIDCGWYKKDRFKIFGRDIQLEDCLIAIEKKDLNYAITSTGYFIRYGGQSGNSLTHKITNIKWQPNKPLQDQSDETKDFLFDLICVK